MQNWQLFNISAHEQTHLRTDKAFHIYKHLNGLDTCLSDCFEECFKTTALASTDSALKNQGSFTYPLGKYHTFETEVKYFNTKLWKSDSKWR